MKNYKVLALIFWILTFWSAGCFAQDWSPSLAEANASLEMPTYGTQDPPSDQVLYRFEAVVDKMLDGDTGWFWVKIPSLPAEGNYKEFEPHRVKIRLWKCNTSETNTNLKRFKDWTQKEKLAERKKGRAAKAWAKKEFEGLVVTLVYKDKYYDSRWVAEVVCPDGETMKSKLRKADHLDGKYEN